MNRREALKKLGLTFGIIMGAPGIMGSLHGYSRKSTFENWSPAFFNEDEASLLKEIADVIIPPSPGIPGASDVGVPQFIDKYVAEVVEINEQKLLKDYMQRLLKLAENKEIESIVEQNFNIAPEKEQEYFRQIDSYIESLQKEQAKPIDLMDEAAIYALLINLRNLIISSFKNSEEIGENILAYEPVPGRQEGCVDLEQATGGRAWSLG